MESTTAALRATPSYIVITPARNEEATLRYTIASMAAQTVRPSLWIIVNDGSSDTTGAIIDEAAREHDWLIGVHRPDRGFRQQGGGVVETFYEGYERIGPTPWDFLVKFDADLSFEPDYFTRCLEIFAKEPKLGIGGGMICHEVDGKLTCEAPKDPAFHVRGATKIYRKECWAQLGRLIQAPGWDTLDELKANMLGWTTRTFKEVPLKHHRFTGTVDGTWKNYVKFGLGSYISGYHPLFMMAKCLKRITQPPHIAGPIGLAWGFCKGYLQRVPQVDDPVLIDYIRRQQINKLLGKPSLW